MIKNVLSKLTDAYKKDIDSNIAKLFDTITQELSEIKATFQNIKESRGIDNAEGKTLELIAANFNEFKGQRTEEFLRQIIKSKIKANTNSGDIETLIKIMTILLDSDFVSISECWSLTDAEDYDGEPSAILITVKPTEKRYPYEIIDLAKASGVSAKYWRVQSENILALKTEDLKGEKSAKKYSGTFNAGEEILV